MDANTAYHGSLALDNSGKQLKVAGIIAEWLTLMQPFKNKRFYMFHTLREFFNSWKHESASTITLFEKLTDESLDQKYMLKEGHWRDSTISLKHFRNAFQSTSWD
jgi:hypothetical protein